MNKTKLSAQDIQKNLDRTKAEISGLDKAIKVSGVTSILGAVSCGIVNILPLAAISGASMAASVIGVSAMIYGVVAVGVFIGMGANKVAEERHFTKLLESRRGAEQGQVSPGASVDPGRPSAFRTA